MERDVLPILLFTVSGLFQLTRSRGAWHNACYEQYHGIEFQLTRSRGAWRNSAIPQRVDAEFQLTRSRGAWLSADTTRYQLTNFNSHAHVERDRRKKFPLKTQFNFNSHAHVERDDNNSDDNNNAKYFNSHAHVERDLAVNWTSTNTPIFQLTRSRGAWRMTIRQIL